MFQPSSLAWRAQLRAALVMLAIGMLPELALASPATAAPEIPGKRCRALNPAALERFLDDRFGQGLREGKVPGAVFIVVQDDRVVMSRSYGWADIASSRATDERTLFFGGSLSKMFTATAVVQLADRGLLDLDADVNRYLPTFQIDSNYAEPVTLRHLLTHTGGFDERNIGIAVTSRDAIQPIDGYLAKHLTARVEPPGTAFTYSNQGITLAGYIVEQVSGQPFAEYVRQHILEPLGMRDSGFDVPFDHANLANGYVPILNGSTWREMQPAYFHNSPAVGLITTAQDMSRFLRASLNGGIVDGKRILSPKAAAGMHAPQFAVDPRLRGSGLGFFYSTRVGVRVVGHRGLINFHASIVELMPHANAGIFVACNGVGCTGMEPLIDELLVDFFCGREPEPIHSAPTRSIVPASALVGNYRPRRHSQLGIEKARGLFDEYKVVARGDTLVVTQVRQPLLERRLLPISADEYALLAGDGNMVLVAKASGGHAMYFSARGLPQEEFVKLRFYETRAFFIRMVLASTAGLGSAVVLLPILAVARRRRGSPGGRGIGLASAVSGAAVSAILLLFLFGLQKVLAGAVESEFIYGVPARVRALLWLPIAAITIALPFPVYARILWRQRLWTLPERLYYSAMILGMLALLLLLDYWNFIGLRF